jgi:U3 small nucleolar RNA-associated protein 20
MTVDELRQLATEVRDFVQSKVGTTDFSRAWDGLRKRVNERREGRKDARNRLVSLPSIQFPAMDS